MRRHSQAWHEAGPEPTRALAEPRVRAIVLWLFIVATLLVLGCSTAAPAQSRVITTVVGPSLRAASLTSLCL